MRITTAGLTRVHRTLVSHLENNGYGDIEIPWDYYWEISSPNLYEPGEAPKVECLGQLTEDWEKLLAIAAGTDPPVGAALVWLAAILRAVGETVEC